MKFHTPLTIAAQVLSNSAGEFATLFTYGSLEVELYQPDQIDRQRPHDRDELYVIVSGRGSFVLEGDQIEFNVGDVLHVPAGMEHRFSNFSEDFKTWVIFYGPVGGEIPQKK